jgi:dTDP-glucose 4,6-dehydratase
MPKILITGGCGFIGHHLVEHVIRNTDWNIVIFDKLTYAAGGFDRLRDIGCFDVKRVKVMTVDFSTPISEGVIQETQDIDFICHLGAETHVDQSITNPEPFVRANVLGTLNILEYARKIPSLKKFIYFSTDEIFGPAPEGVAFGEDDRYNCKNPYAASKAGGEQLSVAFHNCFRLPVIVTHTMNAFGERQHPEKFIPSTIRKVLEGDIVTIHSDSSKTRAGSRFYIHCRNIASAVLFLLDKGTIGEKYNIVGEKEVDNLELAQFISGVVGKPLKYEMADFHSSRPGHDLRYALNGDKMKKMGWDIPVGFEDALTNTIKWHINPGCKRWLYWK